MKNVTYINAGAGSGKTTTLTLRLVDLIKSGKVRPEQVILTTFTNLAAGEFKEKVKAALYEARLFEEASRLDQAMIGTVHGVCERMIQKYWFLIGLTPNMNVLTEEDQAYYISQSLADLATEEDLSLMREVHEYFDALFHITINKLGGNPDFWRDDLTRVINFTTNYEVADYKTSREQSKAFFKQFMIEGCDCTVSDDELKRVLDITRTNIDNSKLSKETHYKRLQEIYSHRHNQNHKWKDLITKAAVTKTYGNDFMNLAAKVSKFWRQEKTYEMYARYIDRIFDMAERWRDQYARFKQEKNLLDYDDMEKYMWQLLQREDVCREIEAGYQYLFVDEFQDSSPIQLKIFDRLSELMTHSFWVGDYKQAIFAFRGSDPDLTKAVVDHIAEDPQRIQTLDTSYRSLPELVALNNRIFTETFKKLLKPEEVQLQAHRENLAGKQCLYYFPKEEDGEFNAIARAVKGLLDQGAQPGEIAVLARRNTELDKIVPALNALHIPANRAEIAVVDTDTYTLVRSLLRLVDNPTNTLAKAAIAYIVDPAATPEYLIEEKIRQDAASGVYLDEQPMVQKLLGIRDRLRQQSVTTMVDTLIIELGLHDEALKYELNVEIAESVLDVIVCTAQVYEQHCVQLNMPSTIEGFIAYIENLKPKGTGAADGVQLVTYHKSKGLQWKYTILTSLDNSVTNKLVPNEVFGVHFAYTERPTKDNPYPEVYIRVAPYLLGNRKMDDGISLIIADSAMYKEIEARCTNEANRLLYVGMTRARDVLLLEHPGKTGFRWFNDIGWIMDPANEGFAEFPLPEVPQDDEAAPVVRQRLKREATTFEVREPRYISPSGVVGLGEVGEHRDFGQRITTHDIRDDQMMAHVGDCVHQIYAGLDTVREPELPKIQELIHAYGLTAVLTQPTEIVRAWRNLVDYLTEHHGAATAVYHERPFRLERDGQTVVGSMDLVWQTAEGDILVDFKTCPMGKSVLDPQNEHFVGRYAGQLNAYTEALVAAGERVVKRYIYYAISGIIAEVK